MKIKEILSPCAAAALYRRGAFLEVGRFDKTYFGYFEDIDLAFRLRLAGYRECNKEWARYSLFALVLAIHHACYQAYSRKNIQENALVVPTVVLQLSARGCRRDVESQYRKFESGLVRHVARQKRYKAERKIYEFRSKRLSYEQYCPFQKYQKYQ